MVRRRSAVQTRASALNLQLSCKVINFDLFLENLFPENIYLESDFSNRFNKEIRYVKSKV